MYNVAIPGGAIVRNSPNYYTFYTTGDPEPTMTVWTTGGRTVVGTSQGAPDIVNAGNDDVYHMRLQPTTVGTCHLVIRDGSGNVLDEARFESMPCAPESYALGMQVERAEGWATYWPEYTQTLANTTTNVVTSGMQRPTGASLKYAYLSTGKYVIPYTGKAVGLEIWNRGSSPSSLAVEMYFFNADPVTYRAKGRSDNIAALTPSNDGGWTGVDGWRPVLFNSGVDVEAGDPWGIYGDDSGPVVTGGGNGGTCLFRTSDTQTSSNAAQTLRAYAANVTPLSFTGPNAFTEASNPRHQPQIKLRMTVPLIALGGLSFYAGSGGGGPDGGGSTPPTANRSGTFNPTYDPATILGKLMGCPCVNLAYGGSEFPAWLGPNGYFEKIVVPMKPSLFIFSTAYNDAVSNLQTDAQCRACLDELLVRAARVGIELALVDTHVPENIVNNLGANYLKRIQQLRLVTNDWALKNGVLVLPSYYRMGEYYAGDRSTRTRTKQWGTLQPALGIADLTGTDQIHPTLTGRWVMMSEWPAILKGRTPRSNHLQEISFDPYLTPSTSTARMGRNAMASQ